LEGGLREQALECVHAIAKDLADDAVDSVSDGIETVWNHSLGYGSAGLALFFHYLQLSGEYAGAGRWRDAFLSVSTQGIASQRMPPDLYRGYSGIAWVWKHCHQPLGEREAAWSEIDEALETWVQRESTPAELFEGVGGICLYAAECAASSGESLLELVLNKVEREARPQANGIAFAMSNNMRRHWISNFGQEPTGVWKISVAHGTVGCLGGLAAALRFESCFARVARLLTGGCEWIWNQQLSWPRAFPEMVGAELPCLTSGWCNGDLGIALVLLQVARALGRTDWQERALVIARAEAGARIDGVEANNRDNYSLCHGHAGRGHIFNVLYQTTGEECFADAARYWFEQCFALRTPGKGVGGFLLYEGFERTAKPTRGFLMGASGLGLALLAAAAPVAPDWDRLLLASMREA
jgi:hypothetical protein